MSGGLTIEGLTVRFGSTTALAGIDLAVTPGEVAAVLGPSGSGKSTLLRSIAGLQPLDLGTVVVDGHDLTGVAPHRRGVGLMFQEHALFPHRDVATNVGFGLRMQRRPTEEVGRRVNELLHLVGLDGFGMRRIHTLSGGEQQRVALARALAPRPAVLLLDEPLGALDRSLRDRLTAELRELFTTLGLTVLAVTHDHSEAFSLADRVVLLDAGRILQVGTPTDVWAQPNSRRSAEVLGFVNLIDAHVTDGVAHTPWGAVAVDAGDGLISALVRPSRVRLSEQGTGVSGTVGACRFLGETTAVRLRIDGVPPVDALVPTALAPAPGSRVVVSLDPDALVVLGDPPA